MADRSDRRPRLTVAEALDDVMTDYLERYARDPTSLSEEDYDAVLCWLLTMDTARIN